jgi:hypothetical protein
MRESAAAGILTQLSRMLLPVEMDNHGFLWTRAAARKYLFLIVGGRGLSNLSNLA